LKWRGRPASHRYGEEGLPIIDMVKSSSQRLNDGYGEEGLPAAHPVKLSPTTAPGPRISSFLHE